MSSSEKSTELHSLLDPPSHHDRAKSNQYYGLHKLLTLSVLVLSYTASYIVISVLSIATPLLTTQLDVSNADLGLIVTVATAARILPKFLSGVIADYVGGKILLVTSMLSISLLCMAFASLPVLWWMILTWSLVRSVQTVIWPAIVKISARWFAQREMGKALSLFNLSFLFALGFLQVLIIATQNWRMLFISSGAISIVITIGVWVVLKESPEALGMPEPKTDPNNLLGEKGEDATVGSWKEIFIPIFSNVGFWLLAIYYACTNLIRQVLLDWTPLFLTQTTRCSSEYAAGVFLLFTLVGAVSSVVFGVLNDKVSPLARNVICAVFAIFTTLVLAANTALIYFDPIEDDWYNLVSYTVLNALIAFFLLGPFSLPSSVLSVRYGGKKICATVSSSLDGIATVVSLLSGPVGEVSDLYMGWFWVFAIMTITSLISILLICVYVVVDKLFPKCSCACGEYRNIDH